MKSPVSSTGDACKKNKNINKNEHSVILDIFLAIQAFTIKWYLTE